MLVRTVDELRNVYRECTKHTHIALDTETSGPLTEWLPKNRRYVDSLTCTLSGVSLAAGKQSWYVPVDHPDVRIDGEKVRAFLEALFAGPARIWAHNLKYDLQALRNYTEQSFPLLPSQWGDTMVLAWLTNAGVQKMRGGKSYTAFGLKDLALHHFDHKMATYEETTAPWRILVEGPTDETLGQLSIDILQELIAAHPKKLLLKRHQNEARKLVNRERAKQVWRDARMNEIPAEAVEPYAADDALQTLRLVENLWPRLVETHLVEWFDEVEMPTVELLCDMYAAGISVDETRLKQIRSDLRPAVHGLADEWRNLTGTDITSAKQCREYLYGDTGAWPVSAKGLRAPRTPNGDLSVAKEAIDWAETHCPEGSMGRRLAGIKKRHSEAHKLYSTYTTSLTKQLPFREDRRLRCSFNQVGTETGRYSCTDPNLQNQPRPSEGMPNIRETLCAAPGYVLVVGDWSQLEIIIMAHYSRDPALLEILENEVSMHDKTAELLGIARPVAKAVNFLKNYGGGPKKLAQTLKVPLEPYKTRRGETRYGAPRFVRDYCDRYDEAYAGITRYRKDMAAFCRKHGYVTTLSGRRRYIPDISSPDNLARYHAERQAANTPIQGTAADICKEAMVRLHGLWAGTEKRILLQVHDEIVAEAPETEAERAAGDLQHIMENCTELSVPLVAEVSVGKNWSEAK